MAELIDGWTRMQVSEAGTVEGIEHLAAHLQLVAFSRFEVLVDSKVDFVHPIISRTIPSCWLTPDDRSEVVVDTIPQIVADISRRRHVARARVVLDPRPGRPF